MARRSGAWFPFPQLIVDAVDLARSGAPVSICVDIADDLWAAEVDADQIGQVLHNILLNAKQAMLDGGIIEVRAENVGHPRRQEAGCRRSR